MAYFIPSYFQKRILRYALSRLDFLDAEHLNLDNLDITWGKKSVVELRDLGIQLEVICYLWTYQNDTDVVRSIETRILVEPPATIRACQGEHQALADHSTGRSLQ